MCRNITELRGLQPAATDEEIEAAARQYVRKVSGLKTLTEANRQAFESAVAEVTATTTRLPERRQPPATLPPLRRPEVRADRRPRSRDHRLTAPSAAPSRAAWAGRISPGLLGRRSRYP